jgi:Virulence-associated protein E/Bifunctional DNA primase/polymerase, N-terminal/Primase C terminal 2 (PriCT-2)
MNVPEMLQCGWALVPIPKGQKGPISAGWNLKQNTVMRLEDADRLTGNIGLAHAYCSHPTAVIDIDSLEHARLWLANHNIQLDELLDADDAVHIVSGRANRAKLLYRLPPNTEPIATKKITNPDDGSTILEFRCASRNGLTVQDILPPSTHPETGQPYQWGGKGSPNLVPIIPLPLYFAWPKDTTVSVSANGLLSAWDPAGLDAGFISCLRDALLSIPSDERDLWVRCGLALKGLGEIGRVLWLEWSATSKKFDSADAARVWGSLNPTTIGYKFIFAEAQRRGWINPTKKLTLISNGASRQINLPSDAGSSSSNQIVTPPLPAKDTKGRPQNVQENLSAVIAAHGVVARYNQIKKRPEVIVPGLKCVADETSNSAYTTVTDLAIKSGMSPTRVPELLDAIAAQNPFCPVQAYIQSTPWDGVSRIDQLLNQLDFDRSKIADTLFRKWLIQAVGAVFAPCGISNAGVLILQGPQGIGKTRFFSDLTSGLSDVFAEGVTLNPADKDSVLYSVTHWIVELGEIEATFRRADLAQLKAFITRSVDTIRRPYARRESSLVRRTVFAGTVNDLQCLNDQSGNRRFWPVSVRSIKQDKTIDYQQLWAEVHSWYLAGERWYLSNKERAELETHCDAFLVADPEVEALLTHYPFTRCTTWTEQKMQDICWNLGIEKPTKGQTMRIAEAIRKHNGGQAPRRSNGVNLHRVPDRVKILALEAAEKKKAQAQVDAGTKEVCREGHQGDQ